MNDQEEQNLSKQLAELRREVRATRRWILFIAVAVSILLFFPPLAAILSSWALEVVNFAGAYLIPVASIVAAVLIVAAVVANSARRPLRSDATSHNL